MTDQSGCAAQVRGEDSTSGLVEYDRFEKVIVKALMERKGEFLRDSETKLMRAFRAFDPENKGYIDGENLKVRGARTRRGGLKWHWRAWGLRRGGLELSASPPPLSLATRRTS